jgi:hypothetical protein
VPARRTPAWVSPGSCLLGRPVPAVRLLSAPGSAASG